ncbi:putative baseplate assembly protein [Phormidium sp. CLA17]|uniref:putative baseplate assembly protein n=1 Tax=Leptolyngbya sp. Cla-17 TaxID=2803751 RepID=UPI001492B0D8|nr:putative baseplate assembly protein [Leptolyngbya sp. Cla-17]MBM0744165.1 putative baseplate assembly protein [Leptolyngbya sp. Cla-17]
MPLPSPKIDPRTYTELVASAEWLAQCFTGYGFLVLRSPLWEAPPHWEPLSDSILESLKLDLRTLSSANDLPNEGSEELNLISKGLNWVIVGRIEDSYHIRIFDKDKRQIFDAGKGKFSPDESLRKLLKNVFDRKARDQPIDKKTIGDLLRQLAFSKEGRGLVIVGKDQDSYHVRIFDWAGKQIVDELIHDPLLRKQLQDSFDCQSNNQLIDDQTKSKLLKKIQSSVGLTHAFQWIPPEGKADAGRALIRIFGRMATMVTDRLNRVPEKHFLAFLNLIGAQQQPPQPARVPLTAYLVDNSPVDALVPAHTQIAAVAQPGATEKVLFETEEDLVVVRSQLQAAIVHQGQQYCDHRLTATAVAGEFPVFEIEQPNTLYIAADQLTTKIDSQEIQLAIANPDNLIQGWNWSYWDGETWQTLTSKADNNRLKLTATAPAKDWKTPKSKMIEGIETQWLRGIAPGNLPSLAEIYLVRAETGEIVPEQAFFNTDEIDLSKDFLPFGETPRFNDTFYVASQKILSSAAATVTVNLTQSTQKSKPKKVSIKWEVCTGISWEPVQNLAELVTSDPKKADSEKSVTTDFISITFKLPLEINLVEVNGEENFWLRARLIEGNYGNEPQFKTKIEGTSPNTETTLEQDPDTGYFPPVLKSITLSRSKISDIAPKKVLKALPSGAFIHPDADTLVPDQAFFNIDKIDLSKDFLPLGKEPKINDTFYVASRNIFSSTGATITITLTRSDSYPFSQSEPQPRDNVQIQWEAWNGAVWEKISQSTSPDLNGSVTVTLPARVAPVEVNGKENYWIRAKLITGDYGNSSTGYFPPSLKSVTFEDGLYLRFDRPFPNQAIALYLQVAPPKPGKLLKSKSVETPAKLKWEYYGVGGWRSLSVQDGTQNLSQRGMVQFIGPSDFASKTLFGRSGYWLRLRLLEKGFQIPPRLQQVLTNTVWAIQATTYRNEVLGSGTGDPNLVLRMLHTPVLPGQQLLVREPELPSAEEQTAIKKLEGNDAIALSTDASGQPEDIWVRWHEVSDFYASGSRDRHYILDRMTGEIRFGGEGQGLAPPRGRNNIRMAYYQSGGGKQGNCGAETLTELKTTVPYVNRVTNHEPANGGADLESIAEVQESAPKQLRHCNRAVTWQDIEDLTYAASSEIARVKVITPKFDPVGLGWIPNADGQSLPPEVAEAVKQAVKQAGIVTVLIVPHSPALQPTPSLALIEQVKRYLGDRISPSLKLQVTEPFWVKVTVTAQVAPVSFQAANSLEATVKAALTDFLHPLTGDTRGQGWSFGRNPHDSDLYARIERIPGVSHVESLSIVSDPAITNLAMDNRDRFLIYSGQHQITISSPP